MSQRSHNLDVWMLTTVVVLVVAGFALGGMLLRISLLAVPVMGLGYLLLRPALLKSSTGAEDEAPTAVPRDDSDPLWVDAENALRVFDGYPVGGGLADQVIRLARAGRRAVERGRKAPAEPGSVQARHLLCLAGDALQAYLDAGEPEREQASLRDLLSEVAHTLENNRCSSEAEEQMRIRLRVLQRELGQTANKDRT